VHAAQLGVNYYHESLMGTSGNHYIPRSLSEVGQDFDEMRSITSNVKFYMNPLVDQNLPWILQINELARNKGIHTVVNMMVDDRQLTNDNWAQYSSKVVAACQQLNGKTGTVIVGNEITLHSPLSRTDIKNRVVALMDQCDQVFDGQVSYEEFWYAKDVWYGYTARPLYWMHYENLGDFQANVQEMDARWGSNAIIGEWGEDIIDSGVERDDWWQKEQIQQRWNIIQQSQVPIAYIFAWKEPSWNSFGIVRPDGIHRPLWAVLGGSVAAPSSSPSSSPASSPPSSPGDNLLLSLSPSCTIQGNACTKTSDITDSSCRYVTYTSGHGDVRVTACNKPSGIEIYRNAFPQGRDFSACFGSSCVDKNTGFALYGAPAASSGPSISNGWTISSLARSCTANNVACQVQSDTTSGVCRTIIFTTQNGPIQVKICDKGDGHAEIYRQASPDGVLFSACFANGCVTKDTGFSRFTPSDAAPSPPQNGAGVAGLAVTMTHSGAKTLDTIESSGCRRVTFAPSTGTVDARICAKTDRYEMYLLSSPNAASLCVGSNCVGSSTGFASFV